MYVYNVYAKTCTCTMLAIHWGMLAICWGAYKGRWQSWDVARVMLRPTCCQRAQDHLNTGYAKGSHAVQKLSLMHPPHSVQSQAGELTNQPCNIEMGSCFSALTKNCCMRKSQADCASPEDRAGLGSSFQAPFRYSEFKGVRHAQQQTECWTLITVFLIDWISDAYPKECSV